MTALLPADGPIPFDDAVFIRHRNMHPTIPYGSVVFFMPPGWRGWYGTFYGFTASYYHPSCIYRVDGGPRGVVRLGQDGVPKHSRWQECSREDFMKAGPRQVAGVIKPFVSEFEYFLASRFEEGYGR